MDFHITQENDKKVIALSGRFTFNDNETFRSVIDEISTSAPMACIFDMKKLEFIDSAGLGMMFLASDTAQSSHVKVTMRNVQGPVQRMLEISQFNEIIPLEA